MLVNAVFLSVVSKCAKDARLCMAIGVCKIINANEMVSNEIVMFRCTCSRCLFVSSLFVIVL